MSLQAFSFTREPAVWVAVIDAILMLAVSFGLPLTPEQKGAVDVLLGALGVVAVRSQVTPNATAQTIAELAYAEALMDGGVTPTDALDAAEHALRLGPRGAADADAKRPGA